jgi:SAM-dependent methyltransferase
MKSLSINEIRGDDVGYVAYHAPRYLLLLRLLSRFGVNANTRVLDIGRSYLTELIREHLGAPVDTLGFEPEDTGAEGRHFHFDLNRAQHRSDWRTDLPKYDVVVMAEVLEHLYTAPELVLAFVRSLVADGGYLVLATPNATAFQKRVKMVLGRHPFDRIQQNNTEPGHFREYTVRELEQLTRDAGFTLEHRQLGYPFDAVYAPKARVHDRKRPVIGTAKNLVYRMLPMRLRENVTMVLRAGRNGRQP